MWGRWDVFNSKVALVAEEARAVWMFEEERVERREGMPGSRVQVLKRACWAVTWAVQSV